MDVGQRRIQEVKDVIIKHLLSFQLKNYPKYSISMSDNFKIMDILQVDYNILKPLAAKQLYRSYSCDSGAEHRYDPACHLGLSCLQVNKSLSSTSVNKHTSKMQ